MRQLEPIGRTKVAPRPHWAELFQQSGDPAMDDEFTRALVTLAHCENLWVSRNCADANWLIDGPSECVRVAFGSTFRQWRAAFMRAAGVCDEPSA
jgi:hypothetical protein